MYLGPDHEAGQSIREDVKRVVMVSSPVVDVSWTNSVCGAGGGEWEQGGILRGEVRECSTRGALELVVKKCFAKRKMGRGRSGQRVKGPMCPRGWGLSWRKTRRDLRSGRTRFPFSLRKGPLGHIEKGRAGEEG